MSALDDYLTNHNSFGQIPELNDMVFRLCNSIPEKIECFVDDLGNRYKKVIKNGHVKLDYDDLELMNKHNIKNYIVESRTFCYTSIAKVTNKGSNLNDFVVYQCRYTEVDENNWNI